MPAATARRARLCLLLPVDPRGRERALARNRPARARTLVRASGTTGARVDIVTDPGEPIGPATSRIVADGLRRIGYRPT